MNANALVETLARMSRSDEVPSVDLDDATATLDRMIGEARGIMAEYAERADGPYCATCYGTGQIHDEAGNSYTDCPDCGEA